MSFIPDQIGIYTFVKIDGDITPAKPKWKDISSEGMPGVSYLLLPTKGDVTELDSLITASSDVAADALISAFTQMIMTLQTIVLRNMTYNNFIIEDYTNYERKLVYSMAGATWNVRGKWKVRYGGLSS